MPNANISFQGQQIFRPGAYYADDVSAALPTVTVNTPPLLFIGYGYGQASGVAVQFSDPQSLLNAIRGGPASGFVPFLSNPSPQLNGAQIITYINPARNTKSTLALQNSLGTGIALLTSANPGTPSNLLTNTVSTGSLAGKLITVTDGYSGQQVTGDNIGVPFELAYTGAATGVTYTVATTGLTALSLAVHSPNSGESFTASIGPGQYNSVSDLINFMNGTGFYSAVGIGDDSMPATMLDGATSISLPTSGASGYVYENVTASLGATLYFYNQYAGNAGFAFAAASGTITQFTSGQIPVNTSPTPFAGATSVPPTNNDYINAFNVALSTPAWTVFVDSNTQSIQALLAQHVETASEVSNGRWRRGFTGSNVGDSVTNACVAAENLDTYRMSYCYPGIYRVDTTTGINTLYGGFYAAAAAAGMSTGNQPSTPLTNKALNGTGVEFPLTPTQINQLQEAGVMPIAPFPNNTVAQIPSIVSDFTTWNLDANPENLFVQQVMCRDFVAYSLVNAMQPYVGTIASTVTLTTVKNAIKAALNNLIFSQGGNGVINTWDKNSLVLTYTGATQTLAIQVKVVLVGQNRFITIFNQIQPLNLVSAGA